MIELALRGVVSGLFLVAAALAPIVIGLAGDPELAGVAVAVGVPLAALLLAGTIVEHHRWRANRAAMRAWSRREHPSNAPRLATARTLTAVADPVDDQAADVVALFRIGRHDPEAAVAATTALRVVS